ncbi:hypothetical protein [Blastococcus deserti]|uniref:Uncharacterized protein n=1 Tax=Blastococcus deserti TaxID=2259033 RepID=A0ABW4XBD4_9ACTN
MTPGTDWIDSAQRLVEALRGGLAAVAPAADKGTGDQHPSDCRWCPVCQVAAVVRGERPEVTAALADVLASAATALRTVAAAGHPEGTTPAAEPVQEEAPPPPPVQQIDIA